MKTYYWPLVLIGATLMIIGAALPWVRWENDVWLASGQLTSGYSTGYGFVSALGGLVLLVFTLMEIGESDGQAPFFVSVLFGLLIAGAAYLGLQRIIGETVIYSPAFGLWVSLLGVAFGIIGSRIQVSRVAIKNKTGIALLVALELFIIFCGWILITKPGVGVQLGFWETPKRLPSRLCLAGAKASTTQEAACIATQTAEAARPTATMESWWPPGH